MSCPGRTGIHRAQHEATQTPSGRHGRPTCLHNGTYRPFQFRQNSPPEVATVFPAGPLCVTRFPAVHLSAPIPLLCADTTNPPRQMVRGNFKGIFKFSMKFPGGRRAFPSRAAELSLGPARTIFRNSSRKTRIAESERSLEVFRMGRKRGKRRRDYWGICQLRRGYDSVYKICVETQCEWTAGGCAARPTQQSYRRPC